MGNIFTSPTVSIPLREYEDLLRESERIECVKNYFYSTENPNLGAIMAILEEGKEV